MTRILGIDPGSRKTGYGIIDMSEGRPVWVDSGCIRLKADDLPNRLRILNENLQAILTQYQPDEMAIEQVFMHRNADSALKLGHARGVAISVVALQHVPVHEYSATQIKKAVVGKGNAAKEQLNHMITAVLNLSAMPQEDAADALGVALCHGHLSHTLSRLNRAQPGIQLRTSTRRGRLR
jgi:crossover junction endodeoxyribonuclease RuvC